MSTFVWLKPESRSIDDFRLLHGVGITVSQRSTQRLWEQNRRAKQGRLTDCIEGPTQAWRNSPGHKTVMIKPGDPDYDVWWAWYVACQLAPETNPQPPLGGDA